MRGLVPPSAPQAGIAPAHTGSGRTPGAAASSRTVPGCSLSRTPAGHSIPVAVPADHTRRPRTRSGRSKPGWRHIPAGPGTRAAHLVAGATNGGGGGIILRVLRVAAVGLGVVTFLGLGL